MFKKIFAAMAIAMCMAACSSSAAGSDSKDAKNDSTTNIMSEKVDTASARVEVNTTLGSFTVLLYGDTPAHRDNFLKLVNEQFYDSTLFHRVIKDFMVQAGDPDSKTAKPGQMLGGGDPGYTLPAEIIYPKHYHKRGALAAARTSDQVNPERRSSGSQFYVVTGAKVESSQIETLQQNAIFSELIQQNRDKIQQMQQAQDWDGLQKLEAEFKAEIKKRIDEGRGPITAEMIKEYTTVGGAPHLDGQYTVFGEVISGMDTIDKIEKAHTSSADRPEEDIRILSMKVLD